MKILSARLVIVASVLSVLIVLAAHLASQRLYNTGREVVRTSTASGPNGEFSNRRVNSFSPNTQGDGVRHSKSPDFAESSASSDWHEGGWNVPERITKTTEEERQAALRKISWEAEKIKELQADLPPLMLTNPEQYLNEVLQNADRLLARAERVMIEAENLLRRSPGKSDSYVPPQLPDLESLFLQVGQLRQKVEEARSQNPEEPGFTKMMDDLERMEVLLENMKVRHVEVERISETLNN